MLNVLIVVRWDTMQMSVQKRRQRVPVGDQEGALQWFDESKA